MCVVKKEICHIKIEQESFQRCMNMSIVFKIRSCFYLFIHEHRNSIPSSQVKYHISNPQSANSIHNLAEWQTIK